MMQYIKVSPHIEFCKLESQPNKKYEFVPRFSSTLNPDKIVQNRRNNSPKYFYKVYIHVSFSCSTRCFVRTPA